MNKFLLHFLMICGITLTGTTNLLAQKANINVISFNVSTKEQTVIIDWKTNNETTTNYFAIQKSIDGVTYKTLALVLGPDPKQNNCDCYKYAEKNITKTAKYSYRLVHINTNGVEQIIEPKLLSKTS